MHLDLLSIPQSGGKNVNYTVSYRAGFDCNVYHCIYTASGDHYERSDLIASRNCIRLIIIRKQNLVSCLVNLL